MKKITFFIIYFIKFIAANSIQEFKNGNRLFTVDLYKKVAEVEFNNFMVSPLSAELALAFLQSGAVGKTAQEIRTTLYLPNTERKIEDAVKHLIPSMTKSTEYTFKIANKIYVQDNLTIKPTYREIATNIYQAGVEIINFLKKEQAAGIINKWVAEQTNDKIQNLINSNNLENANSVIINTIYMNGNWSIQFEKSFTTNQTFYLLSNKTTQVNTMHQYDTLHRFKEDLTLQAKFLQLNLRDKNASVTFILPNEMNGLAKLEKNLNRVLIVDDLSLEYVDIALPTFKTDTAVDMGDLLYDLGIRAAFNSQEADFSNITGNKGDIFVSKVIQKTYVKINEGGIEAAAATAIVNIVDSIITPPRSTKKFIANHPFIYIVRVNDVIVFIGRYVGVPN